MAHIGRIKVIKAAQNVLDAICICPHCGREARYGDMHMYCGEHGCPKCADDLRRAIEADRKADYESYVRKANANDYEPYKYVEDKE